MPKYIILFLFFIACPSFTNIAFGAVKYVAFSKVNLDQSFNQKTDDFELTNLPATYSQDTLGVCSSMVSAYILDATNCRTTGNNNCKNLSERESFSRVDLARYAHVVPKTEQFKSFYNKIAENGSTNLILKNVFYRTMGATSQECSSLDKILVNFSDTEDLEDAQLASWKKLKDIYNKYKRKPTACEQCDLDVMTTARGEVAGDFNITKDNKELLKAFSQNTYEEFLQKVLVPEKCNKAESMLYLRNSGMLDLKSYPSDLLENSDYDKSIAKIKEVLGKQVPIAVNTVCLGNNFDIAQTRANAKAILTQNDNIGSAGTSPLVAKGFACEQPHSVVITGYRRICKNVGKTNEECRETLKIENSWGKTWQKENNDGWVDARAFMDRTAYLGQNLTWLEDKPTENQKKRQ